MLEAYDFRPQPISRLISYFLLFFGVAILGLSLVSTAAALIVYCVAIDNSYLMILAAPIALLLLNWAMIAFVRSITRVRPVRLDYTSSGEAIWSLGLMMKFAVYGFPLILLASDGGDGILVAGAAYGAFILLTLLRTFWRYYVGFSVQKKPFALFLRTFGSFADRAVIGAVLKTLPSRLPLIYITPGDGEAATWDPFLVGFAGLKPLFTGSSAPIYAQTDESTWERDVGRLIELAKVIIIEVSDASPGVMRELDLIKQYRRTADTILLTDAHRTPSVAIHQVVAAHAQQGRVVQYVKSWRTAVLRVFASVVVVGVPFGGLILGMAFYGVVVLTSTFDGGSRVPDDKVLYGFITIPAVIFMTSWYVKSLRSYMKQFLSTESIALLRSTINDTLRSRQ